MKQERRPIAGNTDLRVSAELCRAYVLLVDETELDYNEDIFQSLMKEIRDRLPYVKD